VPSDCSIQHWKDPLVSHYSRSHSQEYTPNGMRHPGRVANTKLVVFVLVSSAAEQRAWRVKLGYSLEQECFGDWSLQWNVNCHHGNVGYSVDLKIVVEMENHCCYSSAAEVDERGKLVAGESPDNLVVQEKKTERREYHLGF